MSEPLTLPQTIIKRSGQRWYLTQKLTRGPEAPSHLQPHSVNSPLLCTLQQPTCRVVQDADEMPPPTSIAQTWGGFTKPASAHSGPWQVSGAPSLPHTLLDAPRTT